MQITKSIAPLVFNDVEMNGKTEMDSMAKTVMLTKHFFPSGLTYAVEGHSMAEMKRFTAVVDQEADTLTVQLKKDAPYRDDKITVKATDGDSSESIEVAVRRNRKPTVVAPKHTTADPPVLDHNMNMQAEPVVVWIGTADEVMVMAKDVGDSYDPMKHIGVAIASSPGMRGAEDPANSGSYPMDMRAFFNDDAGDSLTLMHEMLSASDSRKLMVTDGDMKVTLLGMKTTKTASAASPDYIMVDFVAEDSGKLKSVASVPVLKVMIDAPPQKMAAIPIPTQVVDLDAEKGVAAAKVGTEAAVLYDGNTLRSMFKDDWHSTAAGAKAADTTAKADSPPTDDPYLMISVRSDHPDVVRVKENPENKPAMELADDGNITLVGLKEGPATITVTAMESKEGMGMMDSANLGQSVSMTFNVTVRAPTTSS